MPAYYYVQKIGGEESWFPIPASRRAEYEKANHPAFITVLSVSKLVEDLSHEEKLDLTYMGPMYFDWDSKEETIVIDKVNAFLDKLEGMGVDLSMCSLFATGGKGYHLEIPPQLFMDKVPPKGIRGLPGIYKEVALALYVDKLDLRIYSAQRGRMWRTVNVKRANGRHKVPITVTEMRAMTPDLCHELTSSPRSGIIIAKPEFTMDLAIAYDKAAQKVETLLKKRKSFKPDPKAKEKASGPSIQWMMAGLGIKPGTGFHELAIQLSIAATTAGLSEEAFIAECAGVIANHESDGVRYNSPGKRAEELARMHRYMDGNFCYEFSIGAIKNLLSHSAPDLDGMIITKEEVREEIQIAAEEEVIDVDEYADVARGISLSKYGVYADTQEGGKKRICAISFANSAVLRSSATCQIIGYESDVLVNGQPVGRQTLELDVFSGLTAFNRFASKYGHSFQGLDPQVRTLMMRFVEQAKKKGTTRYVVTREGLDFVCIPDHEDARFHKPFLVWADGFNVMLQPDIKEAGLEVAFAGYPDPRGVFRTDLSKAPALADWIDGKGNRELMRETLSNLFHCQRPEFLGKVIGWHAACFWKQLFHKCYDKFPVLHINGAAGLGKCLGKDTPVLMADGSTVMVQDVRAGNQLLGPDGGVRNVLSTCRGQEMLYRVTPVKGDSYVVNESHILSLKKSGKDSLKLSDGRRIASDDFGPINVNVKTFLDSEPNTLKSLKGWRSDALEFNRPAEDLRLDPYWLGLWLGDGKQCEPVICKPEGPVVDWWIAHAKSFGYSVSRYHYRDGECPIWYVTKSGNGSKENRFTNHLLGYGLINNKHIPDAYKYASIEDRLRLLAGLIDTDGHLIDSNFEFVSKYEQLAKDFTFICRSVGLACYVKSVRKGIKSTGFVGTYWRCVVSGYTDKIPTLVKKAEPRQQIKRVTVTGVSVEPIGVGDYFGFTLDGDKLFLLGDFTVTHNTETILNIGNLFYNEKEVRPLSPGSTPFAMIQHLCASASIPMVLDEYKPHTMKFELHEKLKGMIRDAYNQREVARGGGSRESDDYRVLHASQMAGPLVFIAEAAEDEAAVMERVVLATITRPSAAVGLQWLARFQAYHRNKSLLGILGHYMAAAIVNEATLEQFQAEFDLLYDASREKYMLNAKDLEGGVDPAELKDKQNAKERSVFNHTVAMFGFIQFRKLVRSTVGDSLESVMDQMQEGVFARMSDLHAATTPEYVKVLSTFSLMSYPTDASDSNALIQGKDYAFIPGSSHIEIGLRNAYFKYRVHCRAQGTAPLYANEISFMHAIKDSSAFIKQGSGALLAMPGVYTFDADELARLGVDVFKSKQ